MGLAACGGGDEESGGAPTKTHDLAEHGFSIALPEAWKTIAPGDVLSDDEVRDLSTENPSITRYLEAITGPNSPIKFFAYDPKTTEGFATNLNVIVATVGEGVSLDELADAAVAEVEKLATTAGGVEQDRVDLEAGEAMELRFSQAFQQDGRTIDVATRQYGLIADGTSYILSFTTIPPALETYESVFRDAVESLRLTG